jgi:hypothetical protein
MGEGRSSFKILACIHTGNSPLVRLRRRCEGITIRMDFKEIVINSRNWVDLAQDMDYLEPSGSISHGVIIFILIWHRSHTLAKFILRWMSEKGNIP